MAKNKYLILLLLILTFSHISASNELMQLETERLIISDNTIKYSDYDNILLDNGLSLPYQTIYLQKSVVLQPDDLSMSEIEKEHISIYQNINVHDIPTSSDINLYTNIISSSSFDNLGYNQIQVVSSETISGKEYYKCMLFPVTLDSTGNLYFHKSSALYNGDKLISESLILSESQFNEVQNLHKDTFEKLLSASTQYIIITNQSLQESFTQLVSYKNETGITTKIELIEDILSQYSGRDDAEKLREYLKDFYTNGGEYVLLGGDETVLPIRYSYHNIALSQINIEDQQICDLYFADLTGDWNADNDSVWGEKYADSVDLTPELYVGRLPFNQPYEVSQYIEKLIQYETNQAQIDLSYLEKSFFFCSDQMRDYGTIGQHGLIAEALPDYITIDTTHGIEHSSGNDLNPTNLSSKELEPILSDGFGIVNIIAHGSSMTFEVRTSDYNNWPKSFFTTDTGLTGSGIVSNIDTNNKTSLYLSLGCDNGAFDKDQAPFNHLSPNIVQTLLAQEKSGAVAFVANTRWGWVNSSYLLQKSFLEHLFTNQYQPAIQSFYQMKDEYYYYRDLIYGINYFGDPTLVIHTQKPEPISLDIQYQQNNLLVSILSSNQIVTDSKVIVSSNSEVLAEYLTDINGQAVIDYSFELGTDYKITAIKNGYTIKQQEYSPSIATDIDDDINISLPTSYALKQNYPNPFNPNTKISFDLPKNSDISLRIYNTLGQEVKTLADGYFSVGNHTFDWDGKDNSGNLAATGIYFYKIKTSDFNDTKKMLLLR